MCLRSLCEIPVNSFSSIGGISMFQYVSWRFIAPPNLYLDQTKPALHFPCDAKQQDYEPKSWTNGTFSRGCWFFERGCCRFGDSCAYSHKTWNIVGSAAFCGCWWILWLPCYAGQIWSSVFLNVFFLTWNGDVGGLGWWFHYWAALGRKEC